MTYNEKRQNNSLKEFIWNNYIFITKLLDIKDPNIKILDIINKDTHKEIIAKLDYDAPC
ncbi:hypothetical protein [Streptococcus pneumoniae]|uniref:hypothetical protein n=1 Tax=Streptococcus pneumoniae TaxID=1313 RepID=UPI0015D661E0